MAQKYIGVIVAVLVLLVVVGFSGYIQGKSSERVSWEYKNVNNVSEQGLNALGSEGWEMVNFSIEHDGFRVMYFKRAK